MSEARRVHEGRPCYGEILGWGMAGDANHITAPSREAEGLILAVQQSLAKSQLSADDMAAISAHGTGSIYNDAMELTACEKLFATPRPLHSVKGATGHTMGASGAIETSLGLKSLHENQIPPTVGLVTPDPRAVGWVSNQAQALSGDYLLNTNSGFGGINAALVLGRGEAS